MAGVAPSAATDEMAGDPVRDAALRPGVLVTPGGGRRQWTTDDGAEPVATPVHRVRPGRWSRSSSSCSQPSRRSTPERQRPSRRRSCCRWSLGCAGGGARRRCGHRSRRGDGRGWHGRAASRPQPRHATPPHRGGSDHRRDVRDARQDRSGPRPARRARPAVHEPRDDRPQPVRNAGRATRAQPCRQEGSLGDAARTGIDYPR